MKKIQIPQELFIMLLKHHIEEDYKFDAEIIAELHKKMDSWLLSYTYGEYKKASTDEEREIALKKYIDLKESIES